jgi:hypothetical protein
VSELPKTYDVRLWIDDGVEFAVVWAFFEEVRELADTYFEGIEARWICERRDRHGRPRIRVYPPSRDLGGDERRRAT